MTDPFTLFEINIQHQPQGEAYYPVVVEFTTPENEGVTQRKGKLLLSETAVNKLQEHEDWGEPKEYGEVLGKLLFDNNAIGIAFSEAGSKKRIFLSIDTPELKELHWERLSAFMDDQWQLLARNENTPFAISMASRRNLYSPPIQKNEIKALIVVSLPTDIKEKGFSPFDAEKAIKDAIVALSKITSEIDILALDAQPIIDKVLDEINQTPSTTNDSVANKTQEESTLDTIPNKITLNINLIDKPTKNAWATALSEKAYAILHVVAHGNFDAKNTETYIYLANQHGETERLSATEIIADLKKTNAQNIPRFAFLVSCETGRSSKGDSSNKPSNSNHGGLGQRLVQEGGIHAVVAMNDEISIATAEELAPTFYERLRDHGYPDLALVQAGAGLRRRQDMQDVVPVLFSRLRGRPLYYPQLTEAIGISLTQEELQLGFNRLKTLIDTRAPGLKKDFAKQPQDGKRESDELWSLKNTFKKNSKEWSDMTDEDWINLTALVKEWDVWEWLNNICYTIIDFGFTELAQERAIPSYDVECPFPGLKAFGIPNDPESEAAANYFFGRDILINKLQNLLNKSVLVVLGASGSGKSSVVMAGIIPNLKIAKKKCRYMTPGTRPITTLGYVLTGNPDVVVIDQFEEIFTHVHEKETRTEFVDKLVSWVESDAANHKLILTMRTDFVNECAYHDQLKNWVENCSQQILPLTVSELREVAAQQAANAFPDKNGSEDLEEKNTLGLKFDPGLLNRIMNDLHDEPGAMPLLQFTLLELWNRRTGRWLRATAYEELGGVDKAIAKTAEDIYASLNPDEQELMKYIFIRLTHLDESGGRGQQRRDTRHRVMIKDLVPQGKTIEQVKVLLYKPELRSLLITSSPDDKQDSSELTTTPDNVVNPQQTSDDMEVEVVHEAVIRHWKQLQEWLDQDYEMLRQRQKIQRETLDWQYETDTDKKKSLLLLQGIRLQEIQEWLKKGSLELNISENNYVNYCASTEQSQTRLKQFFRIGLIVLTVIALGVTLFALIQKGEAEQQAERADKQAERADKQAERAEQQTKLAEQQATIAQSRYLIGEGQTKYAEDPLLGLALVMEGAKLLEGNETIQKEVFGDSFDRVFQHGQLAFLQNIRNLRDLSRLDARPIFGHDDYGCNGVFTKTNRLLLIHDVAPSQMWLVDEGRQIALNHQLNDSWPIDRADPCSTANANNRGADITMSPDGQSFIVNYRIRGEYYSHAEIRQWGVEEGVPLNGVVHEINAFPRKEWFVLQYINYKDDYHEIRRWGEDKGIPINGFENINVSPDEQWVFIEYWNNESEMRRLHLEEDVVIPISGAISDVKVPPNGQWFIINYENGTAEMRRWGEYEGIPLNGHVNNISPDGQWFIINYENGTAEMRQWGEYEGISLNGRVDNISPDGQWFIINNYEDGTAEMRQWGVDKGIFLNGGRVFIPPDGQWFIVNDYQGERAEMRQWGAEQGVPLEDYIDFPNAIPEFSKGSEWFFIYYGTRSDAPREIRKWGEPKGTPLERHVFTGTGVSPGFSQNGRYVVLKYDDDHSYLMVSEDLQQISDLGPKVKRVSFSSDDSWLFVQYENNDVRLFNISWQRKMVENSTGTSINELIHDACNDLFPQGIFDSTKFNYYEEKISNWHPQACDY